MKTTDKKTEQAFNRSVGIAGKILEAFGTTQKKNPRRLRLMRRLHRNLAIWASGEYMSDDAVRVYKKMARKF